MKLILLLMLIHVRPISGTIKMNYIFYFGTDSFDLVVPLFYRQMENGMYTRMAILSAMLLNK